jgi:prophage regulatory protein
MSILLRYNDLASKGVRYSRPHLWRLIKAGRFPKPIKGLGSENCWLESEIDAHIEACVVARLEKEVA